MSPADRVTIAGSERQVDPGHRRAGDVTPTTEIEVTAYLRPRAPVSWVDEDAARAPGERRRLQREDWAAAHGASEDDIAAVKAFAADNGLAVGEVDPARRSVGLRGSVDAVSRAFGVSELGMFEHPSGTVYRGRQGPLTIPAALDGVITGVFGIDNRPQAETRLRVAPQADVSYTPVQVAEDYSFPAGTTGQGQTVGIIELGGGYQSADLTAFFQGLGLSVPKVTAVSVDGATNSPGSDADTEVVLDIEVVGAVANDASIAVYFAPNTDQGFLDAVSTAVHDTTNKPSAISISWGQNEEAWSVQARTQMEQVFTDAAALGVTVTAAAGDSGSTDGVTDGKQHVDFPAAAPHALGCGGTSLQASGGQIASETVWNGNGATGGGVSVDFAPPSYQSKAGVPTNVDTHAAGRGVPDVAGDADPATGYQIRVNGSDTTVGGTSAVAPLWAGLIARLNQGLGSPVGFMQPALYNLIGTAAFHDITSGNNGSYDAGVGWDPCTGLGSPNGDALLSSLRSAGG